MTTPRAPMLRRVCKICALEIAQVFGRALKPSQAIFVHMKHIRIIQHAFRIEKNVIGLQFHLEMTRQGILDLIENSHNELQSAD